jgi:hypothetical protein
VDPNKRRLLVVTHRRRPQPRSTRRPPLELWPVLYQMYTVRPERCPPRTRVGKGSRAIVDWDA